MPAFVQGMAARVEGRELILTVMVSSGG